MQKLNGLNSHCGDKQHFTQSLWLHLCVKCWILMEKKINKAFLVETQYANSQVIFSTELMKLSKAIEECN